MILMRHGTALRMCMMLWNHDYPHHKDVIHTYCSQLYFKENNESEIHCTVLVMLMGFIPKNALKLMNYYKV